MPRAHGERRDRQSTQRGGATGKTLVNLTGIDTVNFVGSATATDTITVVRQSRIGRKATVAAPSTTAGTIRGWSLSNGTTYSSYGNGHEYPLAFRTTIVPRPVWIQ